MEQPMRYNSPLRLAELKRSCPVQLFGDESVATVEDLVRYIELGAIDGIHIKLIKCGGIYNAVRLMHLAEAHEIQYMIGGMDEGMMAVAAAVQCAAVANTQLFEVHGHLRIAEDPTTGLEAEGSAAPPPCWRPTAMSAATAWPGKPPPRGSSSGPGSAPATATSPSPSSAPCWRPWRPPSVSASPPPGP